jgi:4-diphosphocytidyl-2-C-methyl-D-erythritol kinase
MIRILAPAKLNLGLEILGRRDDGYHDIRTIFCAVSLFDRVTVEQSPVDQVTCLPPVNAPENLVSVALRGARDVARNLPGVSVTIGKRIPAAAGLGGASSDAAATLLALKRLHPDLINECDTARIAAQCGSDVPFFLRSGLTLGEGRGDHLGPLPFASVYAVIITPHVDIPDKTRAMYAQIDPTDWTDGRQVARLADRLRNGEAIDIGDRLPNAFRQPLYDLFPNIRALAEVIESLLDRGVHVTGAGPSLFVLCSGPADAGDVRRRLSIQIDPDRAHLHTVRSVSRVLIAESPDV